MLMLFDLTCIRSGFFASLPRVYYLPIPGRRQPRFEVPLEGSKPELRGLFTR
jgi:hypothetical protein